MAEHAALLAACDDDKEGAASALLDAKLGLFEEALSGAEAHLAARGWPSAISGANSALPIAPNTLSRQRALRVRYAAAAGAFAETMARATAAMTARSWGAAELEATSACEHYFIDGAPENAAEYGAAVNAVITESRAKARQEAIAAAALAFQKAMARATAAMAAHRWMSAASEATAALRHVLDGAPNAAANRAAANNIIVPARANALQEAIAAAARAYQEAMARARTAIAVRKWALAETEATAAYHHVRNGAPNASEDRAAAESVVVAARAGARREAEAAAEALRRQKASDAAEPAYAAKLDAYLRRHREFSGENPLALSLSLDAVRQACPPPAALLGSLKDFVGRYDHMFTLRGGKVGVATLTPFRAAPPIASSASSSAPPPSAPAAAAARRGRALAPTATSISSASSVRRPSIRTASTGC